jgi:hypothetical protein
LKLDDNTLRRATLIDLSKFKCEVNSNFNIVNVSLWVNDTKLGGLLSLEHWSIVFTRIAFNPKYAELLSTNEIRLENIDSSPLLVDSKFQNNQLELMSIQESTIKMNCSFKNSSIVCQKELFEYNTVFDIYFLNFILISNNIELTKIQSGLLIYSKNF